MWIDLGGSCRSLGKTNFPSLQKILKYKINKNNILAHCVNVWILLEIVAFI